MANHVSALKRTRQIEKRTAVNRANKSLMRSALRKFRQALAGGDQQKAGEAYRAVVSALDKSAKKGVIKNNTASRYKSRLAARLTKKAAK